VGDKLLLRLNIYGKPIANKYCEGKMKSTLERESKDLNSSLPLPPEEAVEMNSTAKLWESGLTQKWGKLVT
jgi:hypothetical protein